MLIVGANPWSLQLAQALLDSEVTVVIADSAWERLRPARLAHVPTHYGEVLSETAEESLELSEMGHLLATTDNPAYNALVCSQFAGELGRNRVYQLPSDTSSADESRQIQRGMRGRVVPTADAAYHNLLARRYRGWEFQKTRLSEEFTLEDFTRSAMEGTLMVAAIGKNGALRFNSPEQELAPTTGDLLISYRPASAPQPAPSATANPGRREDQA